MEADTDSELYVRTLEWLHARRKLILGVAGALVVVGAVVAIMTFKKNQDEADADVDLMNVPLQLMRPTAVSSKSLLDIAANHPGTSAGEYGRLLGATTLFKDAKYADAYTQFNDFLNAYPDSTLAPQAKVGVAASLEAEGKITEAENKYHDIILTYPNDAHIISPAKLTLARLYEEGGQAQQAFNYYVELARMASSNPNDPWAVEAQERARLLMSKHPEVAKAMQDAATRAAQPPSSGFTLGTPANQPGPAGTTPAPKPAPAPAKKGPATPPAGHMPTLMSVPPMTATNTTKPK